MRALILAGGRATRMLPLTHQTPKAMIPVLGRPFLEHVLAWLSRAGVDEVTLLLGHLPEAIRTHFGDGHGFGVRLDHRLEETPLGSGGAIKQLEPDLTDTFVALNGDIYTDLDLRAMIAAHRASGAEVSVSLVRVADPSSFGVVALGPGNRVEWFVEKPPREEAPSDLINAGTWLFEPAAVARIAAGRASMVERELFPELAAAGRLLGYPSACAWVDTGTPERYLDLHRDLLGGRAVSSLAIIERPGWPGLSVQTAPGAPGAGGTPPALHAGARLDGPVVLGAGTRIGSGCVITGPASLGPSIVVQDGASVADSVLWEGCRLGPNARVEASVLATRCIIGAGAHVIGSVLGDGVHVLPGAELRGAKVEPGEVVGSSG